MEPPVDFLGIGAQKAGTTWLHANLSAHPDVWMPFAKELHFFDGLDQNTDWRGARVERNLQRHARRELRKNRWRWSMRRYLRRCIAPGFAYSEAWYRHVFSQAPSGAKRGEITPDYAPMSRAGVERVRAMAPDARLIFFLRDPVRRAMSNLRMRAQWREERDAPDKDTPLDALMGHWIADAVATSSYLEYLPVWEELFGEALLVLPYGLIRTAPEEVMRRVERHIGVSEFDKYPDLRSKVHGTRDVELPAGVEQVLEERLAPQRDGLLARYGDDFCRLIG